MAVTRVRVRYRMHSRDSARGWRCVRSLARQLCDVEIRSGHSSLHRRGATGSFQHEPSSCWQQFALVGYTHRSIHGSICVFTRAAARARGGRSLPISRTVASGAVPPAHEGGHLRSALSPCSLTVHAVCPSPAVRTEAVSFRGLMPGKVDPLRVDISAEGYRHGVSRSTGQLRDEFRGGCSRSGQK